MKKQLLLFTAALGMTLGSHAQQAGEFFYTKDGRYMITTGVNLLTNGDFSNGMAEWTTDGGQALNVDTFSVNTGDNGIKYLQVYIKENGAFGTGCSLLRSVPVSSGRCYSVSYQVKEADYDGGNGTTSVTLADNVKNYQNFLFSTSGNVQDETNIGFGTTQSYQDEWVTVNYGYAPESNGYILLHFFAPYVNTCFANFSVKEAIEVPDDRVANKILALLQSYLDNPLFPNGHSDLEDFMGYIQSTVDDNDLNEFKSALEGVEDAINEFLDVNSANVISYVKNGTFDDLSTTSANQRKAGAWTIDDATPTTDKTRWAIKSALDTNAPFTGNYLQDDIPYGSYGYTLQEATVWQLIENMPAGQYMFTVKARAYKLKNKNNDIDETAEIRGLKVMANDDATECYPIDDNEVTRYSAYTTLSEAGSLKLAFYVPAEMANHVDVDVVDLRLIGWTDNQVDEYFMGKEFAEAKASLLEAINADKELLTSNLYKYGFAELQAAIATAETTYSEASTIEDINAAKTELAEAVTAFKKLNVRYTALVNTITKAETVLGDDQSEAGQTLLGAINAAKAFIATLNDEQSIETDQALLAQETALNQAINAYGVSGLKADEKFVFAEWAAVDGASFETNLDLASPVVTSSGTEMFVQKAAFAGHDLGGRFAFTDKPVLDLNASHGLSIYLAGKNATVWSVLDLKAGDQVTIDYQSSNVSGLYITSANAWWIDNNGTTKTATTGGKVAANQITATNTDGLGGKTRLNFRMVTDGSLDFYFGGTGIRMYVAYVGITAAENVVEGINEAVNSQTATGAIYDLQGRRLSQKPASGLYIQNGKKFFVK